VVPTKVSAAVEHAFRSLKTVDPNCVRCSIGHAAVCAPTSFFECWPMICNGICVGASPELFDEPIRPPRAAQRTSPVQGRALAGARRKAARKHTEPADGGTTPGAQLPHPCSAISPRSPAMSSASGRSPHRHPRHPHPHSAAALSICSASGQPRRQRGTPTATISIACDQTRVKSA